MVWKGKRPAGEDVAVAAAQHALNLASSGGATGRRDSTGSDNGSDHASGDDPCFASPATGSGGVVNGRVNDGVIKGVGMIGKIINDKVWD